MLIISDTNSQNVNGDYRLRYVQVGLNATKSETIVASTKNYKRSEDLYSK